MEVLYKKWIRRIYAKENNGDILLVIPFSLKDNKTALERWLALVEKLKKKLDKKKKIEIFKDDTILLFWEYIPREEFPKTLTTQAKRTKFFRQELFDYSNPILQELAQKLWHKDIPLQIRKVKTMRGRCTHDNRILLNETLVHLPTRLIRYVIIHEACHLQQKNHSDKFRALVEKFCPNFKALRKELKAQLFID